MTLRLAMFVNSPSRNTYGSIASRLAVGLVETGRADTTIVCYGDDPPPAWLPREVQIHRLGTQRASRSLGPLVTYLRSNQPDVVISRQAHANLIGLAAAGLARLRPGWSGKLVVGHDHPAALSHASNWKDNKWLVKAGYRFADAVIADSPTVREDAIEWCRLEPSSVAVVPIPIIPFLDASVHPPHPWLQPGAPPVFVSTANLVGWKRMDLLIDAFADLASRHDVRLLILGEGPERRRLTERIARLGLSSKAAALGWVHDPRQFAARAHAFVLASDEEGFSQVLTEAMSVGCPVITTDASGGGPRYVTDNGRFGVLVPRGDQSQLVNAMERLLNTKERERYSSLSSKRAEAFSPSLCATILMDFLETKVLPPLEPRRGYGPRYIGPRYPGLRDEAGRAASDSRGRRSLPFHAAVKEDTQAEVLEAAETLRDADDFLDHETDGFGGAVRGAGRVVGQDLRPPAGDRLGQPVEFGNG